MNRIFAALVLGGLLAACASPGEEGSPARPGSAPPERGLEITAYRGVFRTYPPVAAAVDRLRDAVADARRTLIERIDLTLDPDRPRRLSLRDDLAAPSIATELVAGRRVQEIGIPAAPIAQRRMDIRDAVLEALARASLTDRGREGLPPWFVRGAPLWVSGRWDGLLYARILGGGTPDPARAAGEFRLDGHDPDPLVASLFFRFVAVEFGSARVPDLTRGLSAGAGPREALRVALDTDPAAVPTAFDGFVARIVAEIREDRYVSELAAARHLAPKDCVARLSGLADRASNRYVAAAILEALGRAQFAAEEYEGAAETLARVERDFSGQAMNLDRDRLDFALTFLRRDQKDAAALRLETFLTEFPASPERARGLFALGGLLLDVGRAEDAMDRYREIVLSFPESRFAPGSAVVLAAFDKGRHRYGSALRWLDRAGSAPGGEKLRSEILAATRGGLPAAARDDVRDALRGLSAPDENKAREAVASLVAIGPVAGPSLLEPLAAPAERWPLPDYRRNALTVATEWGAAGRPVLTKLLSDPVPEIGVGALDALVGLGARPRDLEDEAPADSPAGREIARRTGRGSLPAELARLVRSSEFEERALAAGRLALRPDADSLSALLGLGRDDSPQVRRAAAGALAARFEDSAKAELARLAGDASPTVRVEAFRGLFAQGRTGEVRDRGLRDPDARIRIECARLLLEAGEAVPEIVALLGDGDPGVRTAAEQLLRESGGPDRKEALARALEAAADPGLAMRIVRVMAHLAGRDFGYDPDGSAAERNRVAREFRASWPE